MYRPSKSELRNITPDHSPILLVLTLVLVVLKLSGAITISWWWVFSPIWIPLLIALLVVLIVTILFTVKK